MAQTFGPKLKEGIASISKLQEELVAKATSDDDRAALARIADARTPVLASTKKIDELKATGDMAAVQAHIDQALNSSVVTYLGTLDAFAALQEKHRESAKQAAQETRRESLVVGLLVIGLVAAASLAWMLWLARSIRMPLARAVSVAESIAAGDLTQRLDEKRDDEIGQLTRAIGAMSAKLRELVSQVRSGVESVNTAAVEIATGNQDLASRTEQAASNLQQTASSMEELTSTVSHSADAARQANQLAVSAAEAASRGREVVTQVVDSMSQITDSSRKIGDIIGVIDGIAFQTNILALNASVEAARAGEQGRGFAVVADEVRNLAQRSAAAAKEIKVLIGASVDEVEQGGQLVERTGSAMSDIVASVRRMAEMMGEIASAAGEQGRGFAVVASEVRSLAQRSAEAAREIKGCARAR